jgi:uncharacterized protein
MKRLLLFVCLAIGLGLTTSAQTSKSAEPEPRDFDMKDGDTTYHMRRYVMVLLHEGKKAKKIPKEEKAKIQEGHMKNMGRLAQMGKLLVAGPMGDDTELRGIFILDCATIEEAKALVDTDPAVIAGSLRPEYHTWWTARGTVIK